MFAVLLPYEIEARTDGHSMDSTHYLALFSTTKLFYFKIVKIFITLGHLVKFSFHGIYAGVCNVDQIGQLRVGQICIFNDAFHDNRRLNETSRTSR